LLKLSVEEASRLADRVDFSKLNGLAPVVVQDAHTGEVLMQAFMDREALVKTLTTGHMHYWSRSRRRLWMKGETSGHVQVVEEAWLDCDGDALLFKVAQRGVCCHEGFYTCFHYPLASPSRAEPARGVAVLSEVFNVVKERVESPRPGSYVSLLAAGGVDAAAKKLGEECVELLLAAKDGRREEVVKEAADLLFHCLVLLGVVGVELDEVLDELRARRAARMAEGGGGASGRP